MLSPLLAAATLPTAGEENLMLRFGIEPVFLAMQVLSFGILAYVLYRFMIKPVIATVDERNQKIESGLKYAADMQAQLAVSQQESAAIIKQASLEAGRIIDEARKSAKEHLDKQVHEAAAKAHEALAKGQQAIELEHRKMLADARHEIARLVVTTTERVLAKKLTEADRAAYNDAASRELTSV